MSPALTGLLLQMAALLLFVGLDSITKAMTAHFPVPQLVFTRFLFHTLAVALVLGLTMGRLPWRSRAPVMQTVRSLTLVVANILFTIALSRIPLADAAAVSFAGPVLTVALAAWWLKEVVSLRRWIGVVVGFAGVLVALRPPFLTGEEAPDWAIILPLGTAAVFAVYQILTRRLAGVDDPRTTILHTGLAACLVTSLAQPFVWVPPSGEQWVMLALAGLFGASGHFLLIQAYSRAPASLLAPTSYTQLVWATLSSWLFFADDPDGWTLLGAGIIAVGGVIVAWPSRAAGVAQGR
ncbi:DMT family transporter [Roseomonas sp. CCTCC AB2023176]|uniref:DMT family transporter n=1 Tax=Roseomonas sp. CCTCC AB2023176 TaxID=3342640 RepID=UPI0035E1D18E